MSANALSNINHDTKDFSFLGGVKRLLTRARQLHVTGVKRKTVKEYIQSKQAYTLQKPVRRCFTKYHIYMVRLDAQWQADFADMEGIAMQNNGMKYILTVIDVFSKFAWVVPVYFKNAKAITAAFRQLLIAAKLRHHRRLQTDNGKEFFN